MLSFQPIAAVAQTHLLCPVQPLEGSLSVHVDHVLSGENQIRILIALMWQSQLWYLSLLRSLVDLPIMPPPVQDILLNLEGQSHPLVGQGHLHLAAWLILFAHRPHTAGHISGDTSTLRDSLS